MALIDLLGRLVDRIMNQDNLHTFDRTTDSLEAISNALGIGPGVGLWMFGHCDAAMVPSTTNIVTDNLGAHLPNDIFNNEFYMQVIHNFNAPGAAPEREVRRITDFVAGAAFQGFVVDAFSANVEPNDLVCIVHESVLSIEILGFGTLTTSSTTVPADAGRAALYAWENNDYFKGCLLLPTEGVCRFQPRPIAGYVAATGVCTLDEPFSQLPGLVDYVILSFAYPAQRLIDIFNIVNAILMTTETGGTITTDGAEQDVYINAAPAGVYEPLKVQIDLSTLIAAETVVIRTYYKINPVGAFAATKVKKDEVTFNGVQSEPLKNIELEPNRYGVQVTLQRTVGAPRAHDWCCFYRG